MSHTLKVPGGDVEFHDNDDLTVRMERPVEELSMQLGNLMQRMANAARVTGAVDGEALPGLDGPDVEINERQAAQLAEYSDRVTFMYLKSWTLDLPFPASAADILDLPSKLNKVLTEHTAKLFAERNDDGGFEPAGDPAEMPMDSPTGVSDGSETP